MFNWVRIKFIGFIGKLNNVKNRMVIDVVVIMFGK